MSMQQSSAQPMQGILIQLQAHLDRLLELLQAETEHLQQRSLDGLDQLLADKTESLQAIESLDGQRRELLSSSGYDIDTVGMRQYLKTHGAASAIDGWNSLMAALEQAQALNEANGRIIHRSLEQTGQMLAILRGEESGDANVYESSGRTARRGSSSLTRA